MKLFKTIGLDYYVKADNKFRALTIFLENKIGLTLENIREVSKNEYSDETELNILN